MARQSTTARITSAMFALIVSSLNRGEGVIIRDKGTELGVIGHHAGSLTVIDGSGREFIIPPWNVKNCTIRKTTIQFVGLYISTLIQGSAFVAKDKAERDFRHEHAEDIRFKYRNAKAYLDLALEGTNIAIDKYCAIVA